MALLSGVTNFLDKYILGYALGTAAGPALRPFVQDLANEAWDINRVLPPPFITLASGVAQGQVNEGDARAWAHAQGISDDAFTALVDIANVGPGIPTAFELFRRDIIKETGFRRAVRRLGLEQEWIDDLVLLKDIRLSPAEIANAVQQGHMPNPGILPDVSPAVSPAVGQAAPDTPDGQPPTHVPLTQIDIAPIPEAAAHGVTLDRLRVLANLVGLPPGPEALLTMWNRGLIDEDSVDAGIREGHMKTKWTGAFKRMRWAVLSGQEYAEAHLRDWITQPEMYAGGALTGHTKEQMDLFYKNRGRTATPRQLWLAVARKVKAPDYPDQPSGGRLTSFQDHEKAIRRSNIQPWYAQLLWDIRFNYPSLFQLNRLVQAGAIDSDTAGLWASYNLEAPDVITALKKYWDTLGGGTVDPHVGRAETHLWNTTHSSYKAEEIDTAAAEERLTLLAVPTDAQTRIIALWDSERALIRKQLSPSDVRKAYQSGATNAATGAQWTRDEALAALLDRGWGVTDANDYLNINYKG